MINFTQSYFNKWTFTSLNTTGTKPVKVSRSILKRAWLLVVAVVIGFHVQAQYCTPTINTCDELITNVTLNTINNNSSGCGSTTGYDNFTTISTYLGIGATYTITATVAPVYSGDAIDVWIDFNHNNTFDNSELLGTISGYSSGSSVHSMTFTVPTTALSGSTRLRARLRYNGSPDPCANFSYGQAEDYTVVLLPTGPCNGTPVAPSIGTAPLSGPVCSGSSITLSASDVNVSTGRVYIWQQSSSASGPWTNAAGSGGVNFTTAGLFDTTYFRVIDSCTNSNQTAVSTNTYFVPVIRYNLPYSETFNTTPNNTAPSCYQYNDNYGTNWTVRNDIHAADGTSMVAMRADDPASNAAYGKNDFFTVPGLKLQAGQVYAVRFKYARGKDNPVANTGTAYPEHLQLYAGAQAPNYLVSNVTGGNLLFDQTITFDNVADTTVYFSPATSGGYYFSWYSNTAHPGGSSSTSNGGIVIVDSIYINTTPCVAPAISGQPATASGCVGSPVTLSVTSTGTANQYQWQKNNVNIPGATHANYTISSAALTDAGNYKVVITNPCGTITSSDIALAIHSLPTAGINSNGPTTTCSGANLVLTGSGGTSYQWQQAGSNISGAATNAYNPTASGSYRVVVTDANGCSDTSATTAVTIYPTPPSSITAAGPTTFCQGDSVVLNANVGAYSYNWLYNSQPIGDTTTVAVAHNGGLYRVVVSTAHCSDTSATTVVTASVPPPATITPVGGNPSFCAGGSVVLNANTGSGYVYQWQYNGSNINGTSSAYTASSPGNYSVVVSQNGCKDTSATLTVSQSPSPVAHVTASGPTAICQGSNVTLSADTGTGYTYQWVRNSINTGVTAQAYTTSTSGTYQVRVTNGNGCSTISPVTTVTVNSLPAATATANGPTSVCSGSSVTFIANLGPGYTYQWFMDSVSTGITGASYTTNTAGSVAVQVTDANGCSNLSAAQSVTINSLPAITVSAGSATGFCPGSNVVLTASPANGLTYQWRNNGVNIYGATSSSYTASSTGNIDVVGTDISTGCTASSSATPVTVYTAPSATVSANGPLTFCPGGSVTLSVPFDATNTYVWKNGNTIVGSQAAYTASGSGSYTAQVTNSHGCSTTSSVYNTSLLSTPTSSVAALGPTTFCPYQNVVLSATSFGNVTYQWLRNNIPIAGATDSLYTAVQAGTYKVTISNGTCSNTSSGTQVTVNAAPVASINASGATIICASSMATLNASAGNGYTYQWLRNGNIVYGNGSTAATYTTDTAGNYSVVVRNTNGCADTSAVIAISLLPSPTASIASQTNTTLCQGDTVKLNAVGYVSGNSYQWQKNDIDIPGATFINYNAIESGSYTVSVTGTNGCEVVSAPVSVVLTPAPVPIIDTNGNVLSTGSYNSYQWYLNNQPIDGATSQSYTVVNSGTYSVFVTDAAGCAGMSADVYIGTTGISNIAAIAQQITVYPNPATEVVHITAPVSVNIQVCSLDGRVVLQQNNAKNIDISKLVNGIYMIRISSTDGDIIKIEKLVKNNI